MDGLRRLAVVGLLVAVGAAGAADRAGASLGIAIGDVYCHAESAGPHYFFSRVDEVVRVLHPADDEWWPASDGLTTWWPFDDTTPLVNRTLEEMAVEFARHVAERHEVDYLLAPRCELVRPKSGRAAVESAAYVRGGDLVRYDASDKTAVDWLPDFKGLWRWNVVTRPVRVALVVGNGAYEAPRLRLAGPVNDAEDVGSALQELGFDTTVLLDADADAMNGGLLAFARRAAAADVALVFYSGLGAELGGDNYLFPIDADFEAAGGSLVHAVALDTVVAAAGNARVPIVILDASRDSSVAREEEGLAARIAQGAEFAQDALRRGDGWSYESSLLVAYAAASGEVVAEAGRNGVYTEALLAHLADRDVDLGEMFRRVAARVAASSRGRQRPALYSTLTERIRLVPSARPPAGGPVPADGR